MHWNTHNIDTMREMQPNAISRGNNLFNTRGNTFPSQIIPRKKTADLLSAMAAKASQTYDQVPKKLTNKRPHTNRIQNQYFPSPQPSNKSEVLFLPQKTTIDCNDNNASKGMSIKRC